MKKGINFFFIFLLLFFGIIFYVANLVDSISDYEYIFSAVVAEKIDLNVSDFGLSCRVTVDFENQRRYFYFSSAETCENIQTGFPVWIKKTITQIKWKSGEISKNISYSLIEEDEE